jgi:Protein of unknown function (DUF4232)
MSRITDRRLSAATIAAALLALAACTGQSTTTQAAATSTTAATQPVQSSTASAAPALPAICLTSQLSAAFARLPGVAAGSTRATITLTNTSTQICQLAGVAPVELTDSQHQPIKIAATIDTGRPGTLPTKITLAPGTAASETLTYSSDGNPPAGQTTCTPVATYILIAPPGNASALTAPIQQGYPDCPNTDITITYLIAGRTGPQD